METGLYKNKEIGDLFGITYSDISRIANGVKLRLNQDVTPILKEIFGG